MPEIFGLPQWYALSVTPQKETIVETALSTKGYECFLPEYQIRKIWSDRIKIKSVPLFSGYLFCRFDAKLPMGVLMTPYVRDVIRTGRIPSAIRESELEAIRVAVSSGFPVEPCERLVEGDRVRVAKGLLAGVEGIFLRYRGRDRLVLFVSLIQRSVAVEIDRAYVEPVSDPRLLRRAVS